MEPLSNIGSIHSRCAEARAKEFQKRKVKLKVGDFVKTHFEDAAGVEHMWALIQKIKGNSITGELNNDPMIVKHVKCGDIVKINKKDISELFQK